MIARLAATGALVIAVVVVALVVLGSGPSYTLRANFQDAGGLVAGDDVLIGPARVGTVNSIGLTGNGQAQVVMGLNGDAAPLRQGTVARVYENSLSGLANRYVVLQPGPSSSAAIPNNGTIGEDHTYSFVSLDQLFDTLDPLTRQGLRNYIRGSAAAIKGKVPQANQTLKYFAPGLASTSQVTAELARDEPAFDGLLVQGAQALQALASRSQTLTQLVANTNATTGAIASQSQALQNALQLFPGALNHTTSTYAGLRTTLDTLDPLVAQAKPSVRRLVQFGTKLTDFVNVAIPTVGQLSALVHNPSGSGDLTQLALAAPSLANLAAKAFPNLVKEMNDSQAQLDYFREYTPDVVAALTNLGQNAANYDANGHYARTQPTFFSFDVNSANQLVARAPFANSYTGLQVVHGRCPGGAVQPTADASAPWKVPGCQPSATPPGP
jgi:phospholipid/cholesterol/gamma-HCH transport system substrate-binding protein